MKTWGDWQPCAFLTQSLHETRGVRRPILPLCEHIQLRVEKTYQV